MWVRINGRRAMEFGTTGELRRRLIDLVIAGKKVATAGLFEQDYRQETESVEHVGEELAVVDDLGEEVAVIVVDSVEVVPFVDVTWEFADAEGEGFASIEHWRDGHRDFWATQRIQVTNSTPIVCLWFHVVATSQG
jgi:uncharacterized protein YhfF